MHTPSPCGGVWPRVGVPLPSPPPPSALCRQVMEELLEALPEPQAQTLRVQLDKVREEMHEQLSLLHMTQEASR